MSTDLWCLVIHALWGVALIQLEVFGKTRAAGLAWNIGNRDAEPKFPDWVNRTGRALANHKENFPLFLTAVLVVHVSGAEDHTTAIASVVYVVARFAHGIVYVAGITRLRSLCFIVGAIAILVLLSRLRFT